MHKLIEFLCEELDDLERKAEKDGKLSMAEIEYGDKLAHFKKNLMKAEEMSNDGMMSYGYSMYTRGDRNRGRYSRMDRYSMANEDFSSELRELMQNAPNERVRKKMQEIISEM